MALKHEPPSRPKGIRLIRPFLVLSGLLGLLLSPGLVFAVKQEVYVTGKVESFGGYRFTEAVEFTVTKPGLTPLGKIVVEGLYNGEYPWILRIYTDNLHFTGLAGTPRTQSPAGLVSRDGRFAIPLEIHCPNFGPDVWRAIPDVNEPGYRPYRPDLEPGETPHSDLILMGIDPRNATWVAGPDGVLFTSDDNLLGDLTLLTPFELSLRARVPPTAVESTYETFLYIEIVQAP